MSLFLEVKNIVTIKKGAMDTERTARKLCRLVCIGEESCFAACSKTKPPGPWIIPIFLILLSQNPSPKPQKAILGVGQEASPRWKNISRSPGRGHGEAALLLPSSQISLCCRPNSATIFLQHEARFLFKKQLPLEMNFNVYQLFIL